MAEILSQQEIDSLLSGVAVGGVQASVNVEPEKKPEKEALTFDFRLPHRLSKNQLRTLQAVHESFGETFSSYLVSRLQTTVTVNVVSVDQLFYSEFVLSIQSPSCLHVFHIVESDALAILEFTPTLVLAMVSRLLGGSSDTDKKARLITKIEQSIVKGIVQRALADLQRSWKTIADLNFKMERYETEGDFAQIAPTSEIVLLVSFEVGFEDQKYLMNLCLPTFALEDVLAKLNMQLYRNLGSVSGEGEWTQAITRKIGATQTPVVGILGTSTLTIRELLEMEPGDILRTNVPIDGELQLMVGAKCRLWGRPGISNGKVSAKITKMANQVVTGE
jgi:flagellar motor switch protein FliM